MADERGLIDLDPYDLQDIECRRLLDRFSSLDSDGWDHLSGCAGWTRRDLLGHLVAVEEYFEACLAGTVAELLQRYTAQGATNLDEINALGVEASAGMATHELITEWEEANTANRAGFRARDGSDVDTSVGAYPCRLQAFHAVVEYAIHGDDMGAVVSATERPQRQRWLAEVNRFALTEIKGDVIVEITDGVTVTRGGQSWELTIDEFVAGVAGRAGPGVVDDDVAAVLSLGY